MKKRTGLNILLTVLLLLMLSVTVFADDGTVSITVRFGQSEARSMLSEINEFRTGSQAWAWNQNNTQKVQYGPLPELTYDYHLEKIAMQRAAEIAVKFAHQRPNGEMCFSVEYAGTHTWAENIAAGQHTAHETFVAFREDDQNYQGQGHRRNMLDPERLHIGIGHVIVNGCHYWAQEMGFVNSGAAYTEPDEAVRPVDVKIQAGQMNITGVSVPETVTLEPGTSAALPRAEIQFRYSDTFPSRSILQGTAVPEWTSSRPDVAACSGNRLKALAAGNAVLTGHVAGRTVSVPVTVAGQNASQGWKSDSRGWFYIRNGQMVKNSWMKDSVGWCYLDGSGYQKKNGWAKDSAGWCYLDGSGYQKKNGWAKDSIGWCYLDGSG